MKTLIVTQARLASSRLPAKILMEVGGKTLLEYHVERLRRSGLQVCVATSTSRSDDPLVEFLTLHSYNLFRGSELDVLSRFYECAKSHQAEIIVRVTSDCPLIDGAIIKKSIDSYQLAGNRNLYLSNTLRRTFPRGFDFEIFSFEMLERCHQSARDNHDREHVTTYIRRNLGTTFENQDVVFTRDCSRFRLTVDEPVDFQLISKLLLDFKCEALSAETIIEVLERNSHLAAINQAIEQKKSPGST
jgi:spore coat polysaccharide biosynthesis protein SpsF